MIEKLLIVAIVMVVAYVVIEKLLGGKNGKSEEVKFDTKKGEYTLQELADNLWLKNERKAMSDTSSPAEYKRAMDDKPEFIHEATNNFWINTIAHEYGWLLNDQRTGFNGVIEAIKILLKYIDDPKNATLSSVSSNYSRVGNDTKEWDAECAAFKLENTYEIYQSFSFLVHTLGVAEEILPIVRGADRSYMWGKKIGLSILTALAHDLGKVKRQTDKSDNRSHEYISAEIVRELLDGIVSQEKIELIAAAVSLHHTLINESNPHYLIPSLIKADYKRREKEKQLYREKGQDEGLAKIQRNIAENREDSKTSGKDEVVAHIVDVIGSVSPQDHSVVFLKKKSNLVYLLRKVFDEYAKESGIAQEELREALMDLREEKIIQSVDFSRYDSFPLFIVDNDSGEKHELRTIPIDYTKIGFTLEEISDIFSRSEWNISYAKQVQDS